MMPTDEETGGTGGSEEGGRGAGSIEDTTL